MINRIDGIGFGRTYKKPVIKQPSDVSISRGLKAAGIFASSAIAATLGLLAIRNCYDTKKLNEQKLNPIENTVAANDSLPITERIEEKKLLRTIDNNGATIVKKGDSYWKIAKDLLIDKGNSNPSDTEIWNEMQRLMDLNGRMFQEDTCNDDVPIWPDDVIYTK